MHYHAYEFAHSMLAPARILAKTAQSAIGMVPAMVTNSWGVRSLSASLEFFETLTRRYGKPSFGIKIGRATCRERV